MVALSTILRSAISSITLFTLDWNFTFDIITLHFLAAFKSFLANSLFQLFIFVKCHVGLSLGDQEATQQYALMSVLELNNSRSDQ